MAKETSALFFFFFSVFLFIYVIFLLHTYLVFVRKATFIEDFSLDPRRSYKGDFALLSISGKRDDQMRCSLALNRWQHLPFFFQHESAIALDRTPLQTFPEANENRRKEEILFEEGHDRTDCTVVRTTSYF